MTIDSGIIFFALCERNILQWKKVKSQTSKIIAFCLPISHYSFLYYGVL